MVGAKLCTIKRWNPRISAKFQVFCEKALRWLCVLYGARSLLHGPDDLPALSASGLLACERQTDGRKQFERPRAKSKKASWQVNA